MGLLVFGFLFLIPYTFATDNGNCAIGSYAWGEKVGLISFNGDGATPTYGVIVSASALTGYAWGEKTGWIHMSGDYSGGGSYGVLNDGTGKLSGLAWSEKAGFIKFAADSSDYSNDSAANYGVYIDGSSNFQGYAWGEKTGWIHMSGDYSGGGTYGVTTTWVADNTSPTVTVNQTGGQTDPTNNPVISFTVVFSEAINPATFTSDDFTTGGTATGVAWSAPTTSDNITWTISTSAISADGTVIPSISADKVTDVAGNNNTASTSTDNSVTYDATAPTGVAISGITADSTTQLTITADTAADLSGVDSYQFQEISGNPGATSSDWQAGATYTDAGLTPNTLYAYKVRAKDILGNTSGYSDNSTKYTLADTPGVPTLTVDSSTQITVVLSADSNPAGTYYYFENTTNSTNSDWTTDSSWISSGLTCATSYTFKVKARNGDATETTTSTASATTSACASQTTGGGGGGGYLPPEAYNQPSGPLAVSINNGADSVATRDVVLNFTADSNVARMSVSNNPDFIDAVQEPYSPIKLWTLTEGQGQKTVYVKFFTSYGVASNVVSDSIELVAGSQTQPGISYPPLAESVPVQPQTVFRGGTIISLKELAEIAILPLPEQIKNLALKFPQFGQTLEKVGISKPEDIQKLQVAKLNFPGLAEASGAVANSPVSKFTATETAQIPTGFVFARTGAGNIDFNTKVAVSSLGEPIKTINTVESKPLYLVVKPDNPAESVKGYVIFKSANSQSAFLDWTSKLSTALSASLLDATNLKDASPSASSQEVTAQKDIVLADFSYQDDNNDGVWEATIQTPAVGGKYEIRTIISYPEGSVANKTTEELSMIMVVDPEGYVYRKTGNDEARISGVSVYIYWLNPEAKEYELWPAKDFQQENPQITDATGKYAFLVPPGEYYLKITSQDYSTYQGQPFAVSEGAGVHLNIELKYKSWFWRIFTIERVMLGIVIILLVAIFAVMILKRKKNIIKKF